MEYCYSSQGTWNLAFDNHGLAEFVPVADLKAVRWGPYTVHDGIYDLTVGADKMHITVGSDDAMDWASGEHHGKMKCSFTTNDKPSWWIDPATLPPVAPAPPPVVAPAPVAIAPEPLAPAPAAKDPQVKPAQAASRLPLLFANNGAYVAVSIGSTAANMLVDTGATGMTVSESVANALIANGQATSAPSETMVLAGGGKQEFRTLTISAVTVGGHVVRNVHAGVTPDGADMLLGLGVLAQLTPKFAINVANSTLDFE